SLVRIGPSEPSGSRWATPPSLIQQRPGQSRQNCPSWQNIRCLPPSNESLSKARITYSAGSSPLAGAGSGYRATLAAIFSTSASPSGGLHVATFSAFNAAVMAGLERPVRLKPPTTRVKWLFRLPCGIAPALDAVVTAGSSLLP